MSNPSKHKGTSGERDLARDLEARGIEVRRMPAGSRFDLALGSGFGHDQGIRALAVRPDRGRWLVTLSLDDFVRLFQSSDYLAAVEVKRRKTSAHHSLFEREMTGW